MSKNRREKIKGKIISPDEKILAEFGVAKIYTGFFIFLGLIILIVAVVVSLFFMSDFWLASFLGLAALAHSLYLRVAYFYFLTDKRIIYYYRFLSTKLVSIDYQKITDLNVRENFLEKIFFGSGNLAINTAGTSKEEIVFFHVANPHYLKKIIDQASKKIKNENLRYQ